MTNLEKILATNGSISAIRDLGMSNADLISAASEIGTLPGYHGKIVGDFERVTELKALASAVILAQRSAFADGYAAAKSGQRSEANPYKGGGYENYEEWREGWSEAFREENPDYDA